MAEKIKKFFAKKKLDAKFKLAGPGRRLDESSTTTIVAPNKQKKANTPPRTEPSDANRQAAEAALARMQINQRKDTAFNTSLAAIQAQVRRELEAEKKNSRSSEEEVKRPIETELEASPLLAVKGKWTSRILIYLFYCKLFEIKIYSNIYLP